MKLLFDHHLSRKLVHRLADVFPVASHVVFHGLETADDIVIWQFARDNNYTIVTKDSDFNDVVTLRGVPPKVVWLRIGNSTTRRVEQILRIHIGVITSFVTQSSDSILEIVQYGP
jgi:predicted nuclease of predicted toxin-antitoxin system